MDLVEELKKRHPLPPSLSEHSYKLSVLGDVEAIRAISPSQFQIAIHVEKDHYRLNDKIFRLKSSCLLDFAPQIYVLGLSPFDEILYSIPVEPLPLLTFDVGYNPVPHYGREMRLSFKPPLWKPQSFSSLIGNHNRGQIVHYLDGLDGITLKANLSSGSRFSIPTHVIDIRKDDKITLPLSLLSPAATCIKDVHTIDEASADVVQAVPIHCNDVTGYWFVKPSHPYVGSGRFIMYGTMQSLEAEFAKRPYYIEIGRKSFPIDTWILQPEIKPMLKNGRKWDARFYAVGIYRNGHLLVVSIDKGFGRMCVEPYKVGVATTTISNISVQERHQDYDPSQMQFPIDDQAETIMNIVRDSFSHIQNDLKLTGRGIIILGYDVMYGESGQPYLIEVNHEPTLDPTVQTFEGACAKIVWNLISQTLLPLLATSSFEIASQLPVGTSLVESHIAAQIKQM